MSTAIHTSRSRVTILLTVLLLTALVSSLGVQPAEAATRSQMTQVQRKLADLGYPTGPVDGIDGPQTRRALCAWRRLEGRTAGRGPVTSSELRAIAATTRLPRTSAGRRVTVDRTCQTVYFRNDGRWRRVLAASTGHDRVQPRTGDYRIQRRRAGWHTSSLYPSSRPNMYNTLYFDGPIAIHGSRDVPTYPASHGCVRVTLAGADYLFARMQVGDPVKVIGSY